MLVLLSAALMRATRYDLHARTRLLPRAPNRLPHTTLRMQTAAEEEPQLVKLASLLQNLDEQKVLEAEATAALEDGWEHIDQMEGALADAMGFASVDELEQMMDNMGCQTLDELADVLDAVILAEEADEG